MKSPASSNEAFGAWRTLTHGQGIQGSLPGVWMSLFTAMPDFPDVQVFIIGSQKSMRDFCSTERKKRGFSFPHGTSDMARKSWWAFRSTVTEKRGFRLPHGSNTQPLALDPGAAPRRGCLLIGSQKVQAELFAPRKPKSVVLGFLTDR